MHLLNLLQALQGSMIWKRCTDLPKKLFRGKTTVVNGKIYCGGGYTASDDDDYIVYCYDHSQDNWTALPPLPVGYFGLGEVSGKLVAVGGLKKSDGTPANEVYTYSERSKKWKLKAFPPMPTARCDTSVLSLQSALIVAGGTTLLQSEDVVEIFRTDTSQWYTTDPLPIACHDLSLTAIGNTCYALGGFSLSHLHCNQALYASVDDLLQNAVPSNKVTNIHMHSGGSDTPSVWKALANTLTHVPAAAVLANNLLAIGGQETHEGGTDKKEVHMYSPSTKSWSYFDDLPAPRSYTAAAVLSTTEILVIGGQCGGEKVNNVYKGTLQMKL